MEKFTCDWIHNILVVLCDGKVVCGCADPYGLRPLGDANSQTLKEIWNGETARTIRQGLNQGYAPFCVDCGLHTHLCECSPVPQYPLTHDFIPRLFIEPTVLCNLDCYKSVCNKASGISATRSKPMMEMDLFKKIIDEAGPHLQRLDLFNYGETFVHPQAVEMVEYVKKAFPFPYLYISTNGLMLDEEKIDRLIAAGVNEITFSVDGADQKTYEKYRVGGDFNRVRELMEYFVKAREKTGSELPYINWRYIIFNWNDTDEQMEAARWLARDIGVDRLTWEITDHPEDAKSERYQPGTPDWQRVYYEIWDTSHLSNAIPGKHYRARFELNNKAPVLLMRGKQGRSVSVEVENTAEMTWRERTMTGRRLVRLGAQLHDSRKNLLDRDYARVFLPGDVQGGKKAEIELELPPINRSGIYWLKFDMVSEGIDWFENAGSPVTWKRLVVM